MTQRFLKNNFLVLLSLFIVGFIVHIKSFQMVPYGDDWKFIYNYYTHEEKSLNFSNFSGIFSYLAPYGPAILAIGVVYQFFGETYFVYYLIPLIFKILTAFILYLSLQIVSRSFKQKNSAFNLFSATLFLVGFTGIQAIDWSMNMNVYIALFIFSLGLFFQCRYFINSKTSNLILGFTLFVLAIIAAPTRFSPLVLILPLIDLVIALKNSKLFKVIFFKNIFFVFLIYIFFLIGIFGNPGEVNNSNLINPFIAGFLRDPLMAFKIFMHWIGVTILPIYPSANIYKTAIAGALFIILFITALYKSRNRWLIIGAIIYFIPLILMWLSSSLLKIVDADSRHLLVPFFGLCFLLGTILISLGKAKNILKFLLVSLIFAHIYSVEIIYNHWISIGRGYDFIIPTEKIIMSHFPEPISEPKYIFLDFDDGAVQQSVVFGLGYRVAFLSGTRNLNLLPVPFSNKDVLMKKIQEEIKKGRQKDNIVKNIYAFRLRNKEFSDITTSFQEEIKKEIN